MLISDETPKIDFKIEIAHFNKSQPRTPVTIFSWTINSAYTIFNWQFDKYFNLTQYETISNLINTTGEFPTSADNQTSFDFTIKLTYNGAAEIVRDWPWSIYFYMDQTILRKNDSHITEPVSIGQGLDVRHVNGYLWRLSGKFLQNNYYRFVAS